MIEPLYLYLPDTEYGPAKFCEPENQKNVRFRSESRANCFGIYFKSRHQAEGIERDNSPLAGCTKSVVFRSHVGNSLYMLGAGMRKPGEAVVQRAEQRTGRQNGERPRRR